jgi:hypothetical protein
MRAPKLNHGWVVPFILGDTSAIIFIVFAPIKPSTSLGRFPKLEERSQVLEDLDTPIQSQNLTRHFHGAAQNRNFHPAAAARPRCRPLLLLWLLQKRLRTVRKEGISLQCICMSLIIFSYKCVCGVRRIIYTN